MYVNSLVPRSMAALIYGFGTRQHTVGISMHVHAIRVDQCIHESYDPTHYIHGVIITIISIPYPLQLHLVG